MYIFISEQNLTRAKAIHLLINYYLITTKLARGIQKIKIPIIELNKKTKLII